MTELNRREFQREAVSNKKALGNSKFDVFKSRKMPCGWDTLSNRRSHKKSQINIMINHLLAGRYKDIGL